MRPPGGYGLMHLNDAGKAFVDFPLASVRMTLYPKDSVWLTPTHQTASGKTSGLVEDENVFAGLTQFAPGGQLVT